MWATECTQEPDLHCLAVQADTMGVPLGTETRQHSLALQALRVGAHWTGTRVTDPLGVVDADGCVDLQKGYALHVERYNKRSKKDK